MKHWRRKGERIVAKLDRHEAALLRTLVEQLTELFAERESETPQDELAELTGIRTGPATAPRDPVLSRLLPDFHRLDTAEGAEYADSAAALRSLHEPELLAAKQGVAATLLETVPSDGGTVSLDEETASSWLSALNDLRLALGSMIGVTEDMPEQLPSDDPRAAQLAVYHWLTWMQDSLLRVL
ncbi:DUF2017 domain-containing protein [Sciscionella sediminilitoris]|uniref:DUF2017 domain-containing protein n=1 Tax=Sciscionella sediminilitoris TaxID=1445613 RepID=UPI0004DF0C78|nr:DUF2017 domain-containing protein [Sciscionella sp. SE31]